MAAINAEATADADQDQLLGASFDQLQDVDDVYKDDEPDMVCFAQIIDNNVIDDHDYIPSVNRIGAMAVYIRPLFGVLFLRGHFSLKNWS
jgi:hypothetical protein